MENKNQRVNVFTDGSCYYKNKMGGKCTGKVSLTLPQEE